MALSTSETLFLLDQEKQQCPSRQRSIYRNRKFSNNPRQNMNTQSSNSSEYDNHRPETRRLHHSDVVIRRYVMILLLFFSVQTEQEKKKGMAFSK